MNDVGKKSVIQLIIGYAGAMVLLFGVRLFNSFILMSLPLTVRMACMIIENWLVALVPIVITVTSKDKLSDYGFSREKVGLQLLIGLGVGIAMSAVLTVAPILAGLKDWISNGKQYEFLWQYVYEFVYCITGVALMEEYVFRGFIFTKLKTASNSNVLAVIISSVLFGLFHIFGGNLIQVVITGFIGAILCICRVRVKYCTVLSLIVAHGVYDALITVWGNLL